MVNLLKNVLPLLLVAIGALISWILIRELFLYLRDVKFRRIRGRVVLLLEDLDELPEDKLAELAKNLKKSFPLKIVADVLDELSSEDVSKVARQKLALLYDNLGIMNGRIKTLREDGSWEKRAEAALLLGKMGHQKAVTFLIESLKDPSEDNSVKDVAAKSLGEIRGAEAIAPLIEALGFPDTSTAQPVSGALIKFGQSAVSPLLQVLSSSKNEMQRFWAARILGIIKSESAVPGLMASLSDHSPSVRAEAVLALGNMKANESVFVLSKMLMEDPVSRVRDAVAVALGQIADEKAMEALKDGLSDLDYATRSKVMDSLQRMGERSIPLFLEALHGGSKEAATQAAAALERMGFVTTLISRLGDDLWVEAYELLCVIARLGIVETLARTLEGENLTVKIRLCRILSEASNPRTTEALINLAKKDPEWAVRLEAIFALIRMSSPESVPLISKSLSEGEDTIKERLLESLLIAPVSFNRNFTETIVMLLQDSNIKVRASAVRLLARLHLDDFRAHFLACLLDSSAEVRFESALALEYYRGSDVTNVLINALDDKEREVRIAAVRSLGVLKDPASAEPLAKAFEKSDEGYRDEISEALASLPKVDFFKLVDALMGLENSKARAGVAWTLGLMKDERGIHLLENFMEDTEPSVRSSAAGALGKFNDIRVLPILLKHISDPNEKVRAAVVNALASVGEPSVLSQLIEALKSEPDEYTSRRLVLAIGVLGSKIVDQVSEDGSKTVCEIFDLPKDACHILRAWISKSTTVEGRAAGYITLALLKNEPSFNEIFEAVRDQKMLSVIRGYLKGLPKFAQDRFTAYLSLDPVIFWQEAPDKSAQYYIDLLESSRAVRDRLNAIDALVSLAARPALPSIEYSFKKDPSPEVRAASFTALTKFLKSDALLEKIIEAIQDSSDIVRAKVVSVLKTISPKELAASRDRLISLFDSPAEDIRHSAAILLSGLFYSDWPVLADRLLGTNDVNQMLGLIETLGRIGDPKTAPLFLQMLKSTDAGIREAAAFAAFQANIFKNEDWFAFVSDPQEFVRVVAVKALGKAHDRKILDILLPNISDPSPDVRKQLALMMGKKIWVEDAKAIDMMKKLVGDVDAQVGLVAFASVVCAGNVELLSEFKNNFVRFNETDFLFVRNFLEEGSVITNLVNIMKQSDKFLLREYSLRLVAGFGLDSNVHDIKNALGDPSSAVRIAAVESLARSKNTEIRRSVEKMSSDPSSEVRKAVKKSLQESGK